METEQIVYNSAVSSFNTGHFTSFVQMRGSIPGNILEESVLMFSDSTTRLKKHHRRGVVCHSLLIFVKNYNVAGFPDK